MPLPRKQQQSEIAGDTAALKKHQSSCIMQVQMGPFGSERQHQIILVSASDSLSANNSTSDESLRKSKTSPQPSSHRLVLLLRLSMANQPWAPASTSQTGRCMWPCEASPQHLASERRWSGIDEQSGSQPVQTNGCRLGLKRCTGMRLWLHWWPVLCPVRLQQCLHPQPLCFRIRLIPGANEGYSLARHTMPSFSHSNA